MAVTDRMELKTQKKEAALTVNELLYLIFFSVMLFSKGMGWYDGMRPYQLCLLIGMGCLGLKLILTKYTPWQLLVAAVFGVLGVLSWRCSAEKGMLTCVMMLIGMKDVRIKKVFQVGAVVWSSVFLYRILAFLIGWDKGILLVHKKLGAFIFRWSMGYPHPNVFHISYVILLAFLFYLLQQKGKKLFGWIVAALVGNVLIFIYSVSFTGFLLTGIYLMLVLYFELRSQFTKPEKVLMQCVLPVGLAFSLLAPLLIGVCIAFVLNLMMVGLERLWDRALAKWRSRWNAKLKRPVCLTLTMVLFLGIIFAIFFILIPRLEEAGSTLAANIPTYVDQFQAWWKNLSDFAGSHGVTLPELTLSAEQVRDTITGFLQERGDSVVNTTLNITSSIVGALVNVLLALVFSLYMLAQKETLLAQSKRLLRRALPQKAADKLLAVLHLTNNAFSSFVTGQVTEAVILGTLCCLGMLLLGLPYALPVSVIIAALSLIPIFGAWIGAATGAFLIVFQSPIKALTFLIFLLILQQVEGNLIYPRVVGKSVGLPGLWVLAAVTIGGGAFGILGMLLGVPVCSVVYSLVQAYIRTKPESEENQ